MPTQQIGISPKVIGQLLATAISWVLAHFAIQLDPTVSSAIAVALGGLAGYVIPPGAVAHQQPTSASDELLSPEAQQNIAAVPPPA